MIGGSGVHLFIFLSGFGLGLSSQKLNIFHFYKKRFVKILIPYYLTIGFIYCINLLYPIYPEDGLYALLGHVFLFKMFDNTIIASFGTHFWFLSTIIQFYIFFPILIWCKSRLNNYQFAMGSVLISAIYWTMIFFLNISDQGIFQSAFLQFLWEFNLGLVLADLYKRKRYEFWKIHPLVLAGLSISGMAIMSFLATHGSNWGVIFNDIPAFIGICSLSVLLYHIVDKFKSPVKSWIIFTGGISYSLYLIHMVCYLLIAEIFSAWLSVNVNIFTSLGIILPFTLILTWQYHRLLINIFHRKKQSFSIA